MRMTRPSRIRKRWRLAAVLVLLIAFAVGAYAYTASLTVPDSAAAEGVGNVNGYTIGTPSYTLDSSNPTLVSAVSFQVSSTVTASTTVSVSADSGTNWQSCTAGSITAGAATFTCTFGTEPTTSAVTTLEVAASN